jgi:hypothetical protein
VAPGTFKSGIKREAQHQPEELHAKANRFDAFARQAFCSRVGSSAFRRRNGSPSDNMRSCS